MKVFRDLIWLMQGMMKADHKFYKKHKQYDFPQKKWYKMVAMYAVGALLSSPNLKAKMGNAMNEGMLQPYVKVLEKAKKNSKVRRNNPPSMIAALSLWLGAAFYFFAIHG